MLRYYLSWSVWPALKISLDSSPRHHYINPVYLAFYTAHNPAVFTLVSNVFVATLGPGQIPGTRSHDHRTPHTVLAIKNVTTTSEL